MIVAGPIVIALSLCLMGTEAVSSDAAPTELQKDPSPNEGEALFRQGVMAYDARDFARAIEAFKGAYRLSRLPDILFDIAQAYRSLGDCPHALENFEAFIALAPPDSPLVVRARARREELMPCRAATSSSNMTRQVLVLPPSAPPEKSAPAIRLHMEAPATRSTSGKRMGGPCLAAAGSTLALAAAGATLGGTALWYSRSVSRRDVWDQEAQHADERGRTFGDAATVAFVSAGASALVGAALCWWGRSPVGEK